MFDLNVGAKQDQLITTFVTNSPSENNDLYLVSLTMRFCCCIIYYIPLLYNITPPPLSLSTPPRTNVRCKYALMHMGVKFVHSVRIDLVGVTKKTQPILLIVSSSTTIITRLSGKSIASRVSMYVLAICFFFVHVVRFIFRQFHPVRAKWLRLRW